MEKFINYNIKPIIKEVNPNHGQFIIGPLELGFGITIGNALRRVILSNIPGASVFAIKIAGVQHEFQAIDGLKEDVTQIVLNLKQLVLKIDETAISETTTIEKWPTLKLSVKNKKKIQAADIDLPVGFEIVNKDLYIATKTADKPAFEMEIYAKNGRGFTTFNQNQEDINSLNIIATDSNYSPILQVGYHIEEKKIARDKMADYVTLDIATNGAISPTDALAYASKILLEHFDKLANINEKIKEMKMMREQEKIQKTHKLSISIDDLELSVRSYNCLKKFGIKTLQDLASMTKEKVATIENLGKKSLREIQKKLSDNGLSFRPANEDEEESEE